MENLGWKMLSRISNLGVENLGWKMLSRISNLGGGGKFAVENAISNLEFGGSKIWGEKCYLEKIWGGKCYLESRIWEVENLGRKMLSRISNFWGGKFGGENAISNLAFGGWKIWGGKCYLEISNLGWWKIWGGNCYLESRILGVENLGWKMLSRISNLGGVENLGWKMLSRNF